MYYLKHKVFFRAASVAAKRMVQKTVTTVTSREPVRVQKARPKTDGGIATAPKLAVIGVPATISQKITGRLKKGSEFVSESDESSVQVNYGQVALTQESSKTTLFENLALESGKNGSSNQAYSSPEHLESFSNIEMRPESVISVNSLEESPMKSVKIENQQHSTPIVQEEKSEKKRIKEEQKTNTSKPKDVETETSGNDTKEDHQLNRSPLAERFSRHLLPEVSAYPPSEISIGEETESNRIEKEEESVSEKIPSEIQGAGKKALLTDSVEQAEVQEAEKVRTEMSKEDREIANVHPEYPGISETYAEELEIIKDETSVSKTEEVPPTESSGIARTQVENQKTAKVEEGNLEILKSGEILSQSTTVASVEADELGKPESEVLVKSVADIDAPENVPDASMLPDECLGKVLLTEDVVKRDVAPSVITNMSPVEDSVANFKNFPKTVLSPQSEVQVVSVSQNASETFLEEDLTKVHLQGSTAEKVENVTIAGEELQLPQKAENDVSDVEVSERRLEVPESPQNGEERGYGTDNKGNHGTEVVTKLSVTRDELEKQLETESSIQQYLVEPATEEYSESSNLVLSSLSEMCGLVDESSELMKPKVAAAFEPVPTTPENASETLDVKHKTFILAEAVNGLSECERNLDEHDTDRNPETAFSPSIISPLPPEKYLKWEESVSEAEQQEGATGFCESGKQKMASLENQQEVDKSEPRRMSDELSTAAATSKETGKEAVVEEVTNAEKSLAAESNEILEHNATPTNAFQKLSAKSEKDAKNQETSSQELKAQEEEAIKETSGVFEVAPVECMQQPESAPKSVMVSAKQQHGSAEEGNQTQTATSQTIKVESDSQILAADNLTEEEKPNNQKKKRELMDEKTKKIHPATEMKGSEAVLLSEFETEPETDSEPKSSSTVFNVASLEVSSFSQEPSVKTNASISDAQNLQTESETVSAVLTSVEQISQELTSTDGLRFEIPDTETLSGENNVREAVDVLQKKTETKKEKGNGDGQFQGLIKETTDTLQSSERLEETSIFELELPRPEIHSNAAETESEGGIYGKMVIEGLSGNLVPVVSGIKHSEAITPLKDHRQQVHGGTDAETISTNAATLVTETEKMLGKDIKPKVAKNSETLPKSPENLFTGSLAGNLESIIAGVESLKTTEQHSENLHTVQVLSDPIFSRGAKSLHAVSTLSSKIEKPVVKEISERKDEEKQNIALHHDNEKAAAKISQMKAECVTPEVVVGLSAESAEGVIPETDTSESENRALFSEERSHENQELNGAANSKDHWKVRQDEEEPFNKSESIAEEHTSSNTEYFPVRTRDTSEETVISGVSEYGEVIQQIVIYGDGGSAFGEVDKETKSGADELQEHALTSESTSDSFKKYHQAGMSIKEMEVAQSSEIRDNEESKKEVTSGVTEKEGSQQISEKLTEFLEQYMKEIIQNVVQQTDAALKPFKYLEEKLTEGSENLKLEKQGESDFLKSFQAPDENFQSQSFVTSSEIGHEAEQLDSDAKTYQAHSETMFKNLHGVQQLPSLSPSGSAQEGDSVFLKSTNRAKDVRKQREELNKSESEGQDTCRLISSAAPEVVKSENKELDEGLVIGLSIIHGITADGLPILASIGNSKGARHKVVTYAAIRDASILDNKISLTSDTNGNPELESLERIQSRACETEVAGPDENANVSASHDLDSAKTMKLEV